MLIANFPAAALCIYSVVLMSSYSTIEIDNQLQEYIHTIEFVATNENKSRAKEIMPLEKTKKHVRFQSSGKVYYSFEFNGEVRSGMLVEYVSSSSGKNLEMTISPYGKVQVEYLSTRRFGQQHIILIKKHWIPAFAGNSIIFSNHQRTTARMQEVE